jgi:hypothetical protein
MQYEFHHVLNKLDPRRDGILASTIARLQALPVDQSFDVTVEHHKREATDKQRRSMWGVAYVALMAHIGLRGAEEKKDLHREMCKRYFGERVTVGGIRIPARTTTKDEEGKDSRLTTVEQLDFYAYLQQFGAEIGCYVPDPDPFWREKAEREAHP